MDQGLGYELTAVIGAEHQLAGLVRALAPVPVVGLDTGDLALLPVTAEVADRATPAALCVLDTDRDGRLHGGTPHAARRRSGLLTGPESGFHHLTPGLVALVEAASAGGTLAYLEADYHGRDGRQSAAVWRSGHLVTGPLLLGRSEDFDRVSAPISVALRSLGVSASGRRDEFLVAGLDRYRATAQWTSPR